MELLGGFREPAPLICRLGRILHLQAHPIEQIGERRVAEIRMLDRAGQIDHLPIGELEVRCPARRVIEVAAPGAAFDPTDLYDPSCLYYQASHSAIPDSGN